MADCAEIINPHKNVPRAARGVGHVKPVESTVGADISLDVERSIADVL